MITRVGFVFLRISCSTIDPSILISGTTLYRDTVQQGIIRLDHIGTDEQVVNILTKPLGKVELLTFREKLGIVERPYSEGPA